MIGGSLFYCILRRRQQKSLALSIYQYRSGQSYFHRGALFLFFGQRFGDAKFAAFAKLRDRAEQALRRFWSA